MNHRETDIVVTWLDPSDEHWREALLKESSAEKYRISDMRTERYRDWGNFRYWFRGLEKHANWFRKVHLITFGHLPDWLNTDHPQLNIVRHTDYIEAKYLPTFNSRVLELNLVNLPSLAERFVLFNDDFFVIDDISENFYFRRGLPRDVAVLNAWGGEGIATVLMNNLRLINRQFDQKTIIRRNLRKWLSPRYGASLLRTLLLLPWPRFTGFLELHLPQPYLKESLRECWRLFHEELIETCASQFRRPSDVNHFLFRHLHLVQGEFVPASPKGMGSYFQVSDSNCDEIASHIATRASRVVAINDGSIQNFEAVRERINSAFAKLFPEKCSFER